MLHHLHALVSACGDRHNLLRCELCWPLHSVDVNDVVEFIGLHTDESFGGPKR